jgi:hypothetical protein
MRRNVFREYFSALAEGDPVALGITALFLVILVAVGLVAWKFKRDERRENEEKRRKWGLKDAKDKK